MNKTRREIECLSRIQALNGALDDVLHFLLEEKLISQEQAKGARQSPDVPKEVHKILTDISKHDRIQLLEYEWAILPVERIKIVLVTDRNNKEFVYNS